MSIRFIILALVLTLASCTDANSGMTNGDDQRRGTTQNGAPSKADRAEMTDVEWANTFFLTQIYDARWNPSGIESDAQSNNCGPASLAMVMAQRGIGATNLEPAQAIDHARAMMHASYPNIDGNALPDGATLYVADKHLCISDNDRSVYFKATMSGPAIESGILNGNGLPEFGYDWSEVNALLSSHESIIAYGHITEEWRRRFPGQYGAFDGGNIPHFIAVFSASDAEHFIICDPMHHGGAVLMTQRELQTFFKSPINAFENSLRVVAWRDESKGDSTESATDETDAESEGLP